MKMFILSKDPLTFQDLGLSNRDITNVQLFVDLSTLPMESWDLKVILANICSLKVRLLLRYYNLQDLQLKRSPMTCEEARLNEILHNYVHRSEKFLRIMLKTLQDKCEAINNPDNEEPISISDILNGYRDLVKELNKIEKSYMHILKVRRRIPEMSV